MSNPDELDKELREYLNQEPNLSRGDRLAYLKAVMNKHLEFNKLEHVVNHRDLWEIVSGSKKNYTDFRLPLNVSGRVVDTSEVTHVAMIEAVVSYLNRMNLLKRLVKMDYRG